MTSSTSSSSLTDRLRCMLLGWGSVGLAYSIGAALHPPGRVLAESALDQALPFTPGAVWPYLSFFVLIPLAYLACAPNKLAWLMRSMQLCALLCGLCFVAWPTTLAYPSLAGDGLSLTMLRALSAADSSHNCLPSLHGALSLLAVMALLDRARPLRAALLLLWGLALAASIVMARRHLALDLGTGIALGGLVGIAVSRWVPADVRSAEVRA
ncbi:phosphatase PAP2 family protein [Aquabacterium sp.]|uniref:phosphatase PAP2 family protein n=1 Tax=Aquabacterium sp. TaxID=1872578 RepID=UPI002B8BFEF0|nr:phosphatase PAP2 family protein [Aquabacterium sp.]HSW05656.1 phosphatase PAP2 family protein [Aquabacterium sp.]